MKVLILTLPPLDPTSPPAIFSILGACCDAVNAEYETFDLNLSIYKNLSEPDALELINDLTLGKFRSKKTENNFYTCCSILFNFVEKYKPDYLAISVFTYVSHFPAFLLLNKISQSPLGCKIIIGGLGIDIDYDKINQVKFSDFCLQNKLVDFYINGEGEIAFMELLKGNSNYPGINNKNNLQILDLNALPLPTYDKVNVTNYYSQVPEVLITGSRGCVRDCTFCNVGNYWKKYIYKSGKRIAIEMLQIWKTTGSQNFNFTDSLINGSISSFRELNRELIHLQKTNPGFKPQYQGQFICRPVNQLKDHDYEQMYQAGAKVLVVGIESFSQSVRDHMGKKFQNEDIDHHFKLCAKYGIQNVLLMVSGYPTETLEDHKNNLFFLKKYQMYGLSRIISKVGIEASGLQLFPNFGVPLNHMEEDLKIIYNDHKSLNKNGWISLLNPSLTQRERLRRASEIIYTAYSLGYKVTDINKMIDEIEQLALPYINKSTIQTT